MRSFLRSLNILNWPMWLKLTVGFLFAIAVPVVIILYVAQRGYQSVGQRNLQTYIEERGTQQYEAIVGALNQADKTLDDFLRSTAYNQQMIQLLSDETRSLDGMRLLGEIFQNILIGSDTFTRIRLLTLDGRITAQANPNSIQYSVQDNSDSPAFISATNALLADNKDSIVVYGSPVTMEISQALFLPDGTPAGFLVGTVNNERVLFDNLTSNINTYPAYSYLVTVGQDPIVI